MSKVKQIKIMKNLCLIDAIQMQTNAQVILKSRGRIGLPHKIIQVGLDCFCEQEEGAKTFLNAGDYIAAYRIAASDCVSGAFCVVRLDSVSLKKVDDILKRRFNSSLAKEKASNVLPKVNELPYFTMSKDTVVGLSLKSKELYASDGHGSTKLSCILQLNEDTCFWVADTMNLNKKHLYQAHKGDIFCVLNDENDRTVRLVLIAKEDVPAIKMQEKKEKILRQPKRKKITTQKVLRALHKRKMEKTRN